MSFSYQKSSDQDIDIVHILSKNNTQTIYLTHNKCSDSLMDSKFDSQSANLITGRSMREVMKQIANLNMNDTNLCEVLIDPDEMISIIPSDTPENIYVTGGKGLGKSSISARYAFEYKTK